MARYFIGIKRLTTPRFLVIYPLVICFFFIAHITEPHLRLGILIIFLGEALRVWANGHVGHVKMGKLVTNGPYAFMRNPLYFGSFMIALGFFVIMGRFWFAIAAFGSLFLIYRRQIIREEETLLREWGSPYAHYQQRVSRYLPLRKRYPCPQGKWGWQGILKSQEWKTVFWLIVFIILIYFWKETVQEHRPLFDERRKLHLFLLGIVLTLVVTDGLFELLKRLTKAEAKVE